MMLNDTLTQGDKKMTHLEHSAPSKNYCPASLTYGHPLTEVVRSLVSLNWSGEEERIAVYTCPHCQRESSEGEIQSARN
jgi:gentisate 1,2-dioxygenase